MPILIGVLKKIWLPLVIIAVLAGILAAVYYKGKHDVQVLWDAEKYEMQLKAADITQVQTEDTAKVVIQYVDRIKTVTTKGSTIIKKVPVYVTTQDDSNCNVSNGFVKLWNETNGFDGVSGNSGNINGSSTEDVNIPIKR